MEQLNNLVKLEFKSIPENVSLARVLVASVGAQLDLTISELEELKVAVSEAVSNAIIHGYGNDPDQTVEMVIHSGADKLIVTVVDHGIGMADVNQALQPSFSTDNDRMGLGFVFMQSFMDKLEVKSEPNMGTSVTMVKNLVFPRES
ncbi:anti-sigma F factor [Candidatus Formimonas warabiya]|uniref:Anti-sigma F factor n=2 Tax=Formimonas warabiya TaxID=1761012 RepID=A0A3G1L104_FORW1|nr:anti-sigma F factor [Candidatus Formimonas warabiya]